MKSKKSEKDRDSYKHKKKKKKQHKKRYARSSSNESDSGSEEAEWVEAPLPTSKSVDRKDSGSKKAEWVEAPPHKSKSVEKKKKKKHKRKRYSSSSSSEPESPDAESEWIEPHAAKNKSVEKKREDWMNEESFVPTLSKNEMLFGSSRQRKMEAERNKRKTEAEIHNKRELNPYWKNNGKGVPEDEPVAQKSSLPSTSVGDGGYSWLKKAYYRILEQSQREGRSMEEIAVERWGSLDKLVSMIEEAETKMRGNSKTSFKDRRWQEKFNEREESRSSEKFIRPTKEVFESRYSREASFKYKKPSDNSKHKNQFHHFSSRDRIKTSEVISDKAVLDKDLCRSLSSQSSERKNTGDYERGRKPSFPSTSDGTPAWKKYNLKTKVDEKIKEKCSDSDGSSVSEDNYRNEAIERKENSLNEASNMEVRYTLDDLNKLAAKCIRAELMGNITLAQKLQVDLDEARKLALNTHSDNKTSKQPEEVVLTKLSSSGQAHPIQVNRQDRFSHGYTKHKRGRSNKYFDDDSRYSLKQMFEREKLTTTGDNIEMFLDVATEVNEVDDMDYEKLNIKKISQKMSHSRQDEKDIGKAIRQHQMHNAALEKCHYCLDQPNMKKHLLVDIKEQVYLCLPNFQSLVESHCLIVPKQHVSSFLHLDEDEWREVEDLKKCLRNMFKDQHKSVIFLETSMCFKYCPHAFLECIPVPEETGDMAPFYFKKAIQESETEWAHNQKLVDVGNKGLRRSVPKNLPYFYVEFDPAVHAGYAHVIEEEKYFPRNFGKEIIGGMLDIDYNHLFKNRRENPLKKSSEVLKFEQMWNQFNSENV